MARMYRQASNIINFVLCRTVVSGDPSGLLPALPTSPVPMAALLKQLLEQQQSPPGQILGMQPHMPGNSHQVPMAGCCSSC